jgi:hypothetical protein
MATQQIEKDNYLFEAFYYESIVFGKMTVLTKHLVGIIGDIRYILSVQCYYLVGYYKVKHLSLKKS